MTLPIRICMIGAGRVGKLHSGTLKRHVPGGDVVALVDPWAEVRDATGDEFGIERRFASLADALDAVDFDAVVITTPTPTHRELAVLAAEHAEPAGPPIHPSAANHALYRPLVDRHVALQRQLAGIFTT